MKTLNVIKLCLSFLVILTTTPLLAQTTCKDWDGGARKYVFDVAESNGEEYWDACADANTVGEWSCNATGQVVMTRLSCPYGCRDGKCNSVPQPLPSPSPGGYYPSPTGSPSPGMPSVTNCYFKLSLSEAIDASGRATSRTPIVETVFGNFEGQVKSVLPGDGERGSEVEVFSTINGTSELMGRYVLSDAKIQLAENTVAGVKRVSPTPTINSTLKSFAYIPYLPTVRSIRIRSSNGDLVVPLADADFVYGGRHYCTSSNCVGNNLPLKHGEEVCCANTRSYLSSTSPTGYVCGTCGDGRCMAYEDFVTCPTDCRGF